MNKNDFLSHQINISLMRANWWIAFSKTQACLDRKIYHGCFSDPNQTEFTDDEKIKDAMNTADNHIRNAQEYINSVQSVE